MIHVLLPFHAGCALLSLCLFIGRGTCMWRGRPVRRHFWRRTLPDTVDTALLASGVGMAYLMDIAPWAHAWLAAKLIALFCYIALGLTALRFGRTLWLRRLSFIAALIVFGYILAVARSMQAAPWM